MDGVSGAQPVDEYDDQPDVARHLDDALASLYAAQSEPLPPSEANDLRKAIAATTRVVDSVEYRETNGDGR